MNRRANRLEVRRGIAKRRSRLELIIDQVGHSKSRNKNEHRWKKGLFTESRKTYSTNVSVERFIRVDFTWGSVTRLY